MATNKKEIKRLELIEGLKYYLSMGKSQADAAKLLQVSQRSISIWIKQNPEIKSAIQAMRKGAIVNPFHLENSRAAFMIFLRTEKPQLYQSLLFSATKFKGSLNPVFERTVTQYQKEQIRAILAKCGLNKKNFQDSEISAATDGKKKNINELSFKEGNKVIRQLKCLYYSLTGKVF